VRLIDATSFVLNSPFDKLDALLSTNGLAG